VQSDFTFSKLLIEKGADVNVRSIDNWTPLHVCACWNKPISLKLLLENGADPDLVDNDGKKPIELAHQCNNIQCEKILREMVSKKMPMSDLVTSDFSLSQLTLESDDTLEACTNTPKSAHKSQTKMSDRSTPQKTPSKRPMSGNDLETLICELIDMKLEQRRAEVSAATGTLTPTLSVRNSSITSSNATETPQSKSRSSRFHSPERPSRIKFESPREESLQNIVKLEENLEPAPSTLASPKLDRKPSKVYSKLKNWLNKSNGLNPNSNNSNNNSEATEAKLSQQLFASAKNLSLASMCLGSAIQNANSDYNIQQKAQNRPSPLTINPTKPKIDPNSRLNSPGTRSSPRPILIPNGTPKSETKDEFQLSDFGMALENIELKTKQLMDDDAFLAAMKKATIKPEPQIDLNKAFNEAKRRVGSAKIEFGETPSDVINERFYQVEDDDIYFKETTLLTSDRSAEDSEVCDENYYTAASGASSVIYSWDIYDRVNVDKIMDEIVEKSVLAPNCVSEEIKRLTHAELRRRIEAYGDRPGPVTGTTRAVHELRLMQLINNVPVNKIDNEFDECKKGFSVELVRALSGRFDELNESIERKMVDFFLNSNSGQMREGSLKASFNYLLIDPRVSQNLPARAKHLDKIEVLRTFVASIFYIGKGTRSRPYAHLYDTLKLWKNEHCQQSYKPVKKSRKINQIMNIWDDSCGVVSLHLFQNVIPTEAYTREAAMIDAIGLQHLTNMKKGNYYGETVEWMPEMKRKLGVILLKKACDIFIAEGERQIKPVDI